uniref:Nanos-type domain-containing protein n=1 Tax=Setaria digitata TaxID=48799 RepID=A0A915Q8C0_9BILA
MSSLSNVCNESNDIGFSMHFSEVTRAEATDHDLINSWPAGWMDRHFRNCAPCNTASTLTYTNNSEKGAVTDPQRDELAVLDGDINRLSASFTSPPSLVSLANCAPAVGLPSGNRYFGTEDHSNNSWLVSETAAAILNLHANLSAFLESWKPSVELGNGSAVLQGTTTTTNTATPRKLKDVLPNQLTFPATPSLLPLNPLQENIFASGFFGPRNCLDASRNVCKFAIFAANNKKQLADKWYCVFCFNNARFAYEKCGIVLYPKLNGPWRTHVCKDSKGVVICPALAAHVCRHCGATGKFAHTEKYCDSARKRRDQRMKILNRVH